LTDGVSAAYNDFVKVTDLLPSYIWYMAKDLVIMEIDNLIRSCREFPREFNAMLRRLYGREFNEDELRYLGYALYYIKQLLMESIR